MRKKTVQGYFNQNAAGWVERYYKDDFDSVTFQDRLTAGLALLEKHGHANMSVLDAGCGTGVSTRALLLAGYQAFGCDIGMEMARTAKGAIDDSVEEEHGGVVVADLQKCPFSNASLDAVLMLGVLGFTDSPGKVLDQIQRILKPGGLLVISSASERLLLERISDAVSYLPTKVYLFLKAVATGRRLQAAESGAGFYAQNLRYHDPRQFDRLITRHRFHRLSSRAVNFGKLHFMGKEILPEHWSIGLSRLVAMVARHEPFRWLERHARHYVVCMERR